MRATCIKCLICMTNNVGRTAHVDIHVDMDFIELTPSEGKKYCLVVVDMFSKFRFRLRTHCAYHPQYGGAVERVNGSLKTKLAKCCEETELSWPKALPLVLMHIRMRARPPTHLSPYEVLYGCPAIVGAEPPRW